MRWLSQTLAVTGAQPAHDSAAPQLVGGRDRRHRRRRRRVRLGAVDCRGLLGGDAAVRIPASRARHAQRRRQRDDERPRRARGRHHQAGARDPARRPDAARLGGAVRHHRPAEEVVTGHGGQRAAARHRAGGHDGPRGGLDRRGPDVRVRHQRSHRRPRRQRAVREPRASATRLSPARTAGRSSACSRPTAASRRPRSGATRVCCRAPTGAATRISRCSRGSSRRLVRHVHATGSDPTRRSTSWSAARTSTTPASRGR